MHQIRFLLRFISVVQLFFGVLFVLPPTATAPLLGLQPAAPPWVSWLLVMLGARFLGYAYGMFVAANDPRRNQTWINTMIVVQAIDWIGTAGYLLARDVSLRNVSGAAFLPLIFIAGLLWWHPHRWPSDAAPIQPSPSPSRGAEFR